ncbi:MarR family winged helix-turn-helix transcriptional regulator [Cucumibacter marinus]|uniref:MarR family winged helix-turn-helix transcriptional regulator n=1 Tax=Cucumibacter marinus TaxID=1121252 RepID=UPI0004079529|nr:MarR family winged helix-turn-helix transcriptional regulator [Cucumibacter marinus]
MSDHTEPSASAIAAWSRLMRVSRQLHEAVEGDLKAAGLPPLEWYDVLHELATAEEGRLRPYQLVDRMLLAQYNVSRLLQRMQDKGLVDRLPDDADGRGHWVAITQSGRAMRRAMWAVYGPAIARLVDGRMDEAGQRQIHALLTRLGQRG